MISLINGICFRYDPDFRYRPKVKSPPTMVSNTIAGITNNMPGPRLAWFSQLGVRGSQYLNLKATCDVPPIELFSDLCLAI